MGRELRRKQAKREGKSVENDLKIEEFSLKKAIILLVIIIVSCLILWLGAALFKTKELNWFSKEEKTTNTSNNNTSVNNSILASNSLNRSEDEYYVYFYDFNEEIKSIENTLDKKISSKIYRVDTNSGLNKNYVSDESNTNAKSLDELKVKAPTLIKVHRGEIIEYYEGKDVINNSFGE